MYNAYRYNAVLYNVVAAPTAEPGVYQFVSTRLPARPERFYRLTGDANQATYRRVV